MAPPAPTRLHRVRTRAAFADLAAHGRRARAGVLSVTYSPAPGPPAFAWSVTKKVGGAVVRNRIRRRLRAAATSLDPAPGTYLVRVAPGAADATFSQLKGDLAHAIERVGAR